MYPGFPLIHTYFGQTPKRHRLQVRSHLGSNLFTYSQFHNMPLIVHDIPGTCPVCGIEFFRLGVEVGSDARELTIRWWYLHENCGTACSGDTIQSTGGNLEDSEPADEPEAQ